MNNDILAQAIEIYDAMCDNAPYDPLDEVLYDEALHELLLGADHDDILAEFITCVRNGSPVPLYVCADLDARGLDLNALESSITL